MSDIYKWLLIIYKIPAEPSRYRVSVWRHLKESGAVYLQNSVCILPETNANTEIFRSLSNEIEQAGGECLLLTVKPSDESNRQKIIDRFNEERDIEYSEFIEQSQAFLEEIRQETERQNFTYAELEENDEGLKRLANWLEKIKGRDFFSASKASESEKYFALCQDVLEGFASRVFSANQGS